MRVEEVFQEIGELGQSQLLFVCLLSLIRSSMAMLIMRYTFLRRPIPFNCSMSQDVYYSETNQVGNFSYCNIQEDCGDIQFDPEYGTSVMSEWNLICER